MLKQSNCFRVLIKEKPVVNQCLRLKGDSLKMAKKFSFIFGHLKKIKDHTINKQYFRYKLEAKFLA